MKVLTFKSSIFVCLFLFANLSFANTTPTFDAIEFLIKKEFNKKINKSFPTTADGKLELSNRFGKIDLKTWNKNEVKIDVEITVFASSEGDAQDVFDRIDIDFSNATGYVQAETVISSNKNKSWNWWGSSSSGKFEIDYVVYMPATNKLNLEIQHGKAFITDVKGHVNADATHSDINFKNIDNDLNLEVAHGNSSVDKVNKLNAKIRHGSFNLGEATAANLESRHSNVNIGKIGKMKFNAAHGNVSIGTANNLDMEVVHGNIKIGTVNTIDVINKYSNLIINSLTQKIECETAFGDVKLKSVSQQFTGIRFEGQHSDMSVQLEGDTPFSMDVAGEHSSVNYPSGMKIKHHEKKNYSINVRGHHGNASAPLIYARVTHGGLNVNY